MSTPSSMPSPARRIGQTATFFPEMRGIGVTSSGVSMSTCSIGKSFVASYVRSSVTSSTSLRKWTVGVSLSRRYESLCWTSGCVTSITGIACATVSLDAHDRRSRRDHLAFGRGVLPPAELARERACRRHPRRPLRPLQRRCWRRSIRSCTRSAGRTRGACSLPTRRAVRGGRAPTSSASRATRCTPPGRRSSPTSRSRPSTSATRSPTLWRATGVSGSRCSGRHTRCCCRSCASGSPGVVSRSITPPAELHAQIDHTIFEEFSRGVFTDETRRVLRRDDRRRSMSTRSRSRARRSACC